MNEKYEQQNIPILCEVKTPVKRCGIMASIIDFKLIVLEKDGHWDY